MSEGGPLTPVGAAIDGCVLFHLNLQYSSIEVADRPRVIERCYEPMLGLLDGRPWLRLAVEASGWTLETIAALRPAWLERLRAHLDAGRVEWIGSGDTQLVGPLVPSAVNLWNQELGQTTYERLLGRRARTALVGEMAWSQGLVPAYRAAGYTAVCMEWNNPRRHHPEWPEAWRWRNATTAGPSAERATARNAGERIAVHWVDSVAFQKLQRAAVGDLRPEEYRAWVLEQARRAAADSEGAGTSRPRLFLYAGDAEVFDFRPGRYGTEPLLNGVGEWAVIGELFDLLHADGLHFGLPAELLEPGLEAALEAGGTCSDWPRVRLSSGADPVPVKKQPKYNVTRWALSGRDDVGLNSHCFARAAELEERASVVPSEWRALCRAWSSDYRTHLTAERWRVLSAGEPRAGATLAEHALADPAPAVELRHETRGRELRVRAEGVTLVLDVERGLAIRSLAFAATGAEPVLGTLPHGYFEAIDWAADFYSGHFIAEVPTRGRFTDLAPAAVRVTEVPGNGAARRMLRIEAEIPTGLGALTKRVLVGADSVALEYGFAAWGERPHGTLRAGVLTLDPAALGGGLLEVRCENGGGEERFPLDADCDHGRAVSMLVSAGAAFGATAGRLWIGERDPAPAGEPSGSRVTRGLELRWPQALAAALPLVSARQVDGKRWCRVAFSLSELDETHRPGARLRDFRLELRGVRTPA